MKRKKRSVTLIEIMIVILLIGLIGGALAYNMSGSLNQGKKFKTKQGAEKIHDILMFEYMNGNDSIDKIVQNWTTVLKDSSLVDARHYNDLIVDGWKQPYVVTKDPNNSDEICVKSPNLQ